MLRMIRTRRIVGWAVSTGVVLLLSWTALAQMPKTAAAPRFQVDPSWPKDMTNNWILGAVTGVFVDARDHVWVTHPPETLTEEETSQVQKPPIGTCCTPAPTVIELDQAGHVVQGWGDPSQDISIYPRNPHGIFVDHNNFVWIGTYMHHRVMKFTREGKHLMTIGEYDKNAGSNDTTLLGGPAGIWVDPKTNEVFIADGYLAGSRSAVALHGRWHEPQDLDSAAQRSRSGRRVRTRRSAAWPDAAAARHERRFEGQPVRRRSVDRAPRPAIYSAGGRNSLTFVDIY
jgi:hypothetical protein